MGPEARSRFCNFGEHLSLKQKKMNNFYVKLLFSVIPDRYWLGNCKILKADGHFIARK
jgi:hypothetical protein